MTEAEARALTHEGLFSQIISLAEKRQSHLKFNRSLASARRGLEDAAEALEILHSEFMRRIHAASHEKQEIYLRLQKAQKAFNNELRLDEPPGAAPHMAPGVDPYLDWKGNL